MYGFPLFPLFIFIISASLGDERVTYNLNISPCSFCSSSSITEHYYICTGSFTEALFTTILELDLIYILPSKKYGCCMRQIIKQTETVLVSQITVNFLHEANRIPYPRLKSLEEFSSLQHGQVYRYKFNIKKHMYLMRL